MPFSIEGCLLVSLAIAILSYKLVPPLRRGVGHTSQLPKSKEVVLPTSLLHLHTRELRAGGRLGDELEHIAYF